MYNVSIDLCTPAVYGLCTVCTSCPTTDVNSDLRKWGENENRFHLHQVSSWKTGAPYTSTIVRQSSEKIYIVCFGNFIASHLLFATIVVVWVGPRQYNCHNKYQSRSDAVKQKVLSFQEDSQKLIMVIQIEFTPLSLSRLQNVFLELGSVASIKLIYPDVSVANQIINT